MKKNFYLFMAIAMFIATLGFVFLGFCLLDPSGENFFYIILIGISGFMGSVWYWLSYKESNR